MIFVSLGTHHQPFPRLVDALATLPADELVVQHGHSAPPPGVREARAFLPMPELAARMREAEVVVLHAGVGSILLARRLGHRPVVVPRRRAYGEHVDDHQVELTTELERGGSVVAVWDVSELPATVAAAERAGTPRAPEEGPLHRAVRAALAG